MAKFRRGTYAFRSMWRGLLALDGGLVYGIILVILMRRVFYDFQNGDIRGIAQHHAYKL